MQSESIFFLISFIGSSLQGNPCSPISEAPALFDGMTKIKSYEARSSEQLLRMDLRAPVTATEFSMTSIFGFDIVTIQGQRFSRAQEICRDIDYRSQNISHHRSGAAGETITEAP